jgi:HK97 family phage prohead protease
MDTLSRPLQGVVKYFPFREVKADVDQRIISGYASTWDEDRVRDRIEKGAFKKTLSERGPSNGKSKVKAMWNHRETIGVVTNAKEDSRGLFVTMKVSETQRGNDVMTLVKDGAMDSFSIGFDIVKYEFDEADSDVEMPLRIIKEAKLYEVSVVDFPANEAAMITDIKSQIDHALTETQSYIDQQLAAQIKTRLDEELAALDLEGIGQTIQELVEKALGEAAATVTEDPPDTPIIPDETAVEEDVSDTAALTVNDTPPTLDPELVANLVEAANRFQALLLDTDTEPDSTPPVSLEEEPPTETTDDPESLQSALARINDILTPTQ